MRIKEEFVTVTDKDSSITVSTDTKLFSGMIRSNETASFIISCLEKETNVDEIVSKLLNEYDVNEEKATNDVLKVIETLRQIGALHE